MSARIRMVRKADLRSVASILTSAFQDDPFFDWFFPDPVTRPVLTGVWMRNTAENSMAAGHAFLAENSDTAPPPAAAALPIAAALWSPPDVELFDAAGFRQRWGLLVGANPSRVDELREGLHLVGSAHPSEGHFYLSTIGVDPQRRSQGLGRPLVERVLTIADAERVPCYLESSTARNLTFYRRFGFEVMDEVELPNGPVIRPMWREPN